MFRSICHLGDGSQSCECCQLSQRPHQMVTLKGCRLVLKKGWGPFFAFYLQATSQEPKWMETMLENVTHYCREDHCSLTSDALQLFTLSSKWITLFYQPWKCTLNRSLLSLNQLLYWLPASCCLTVIILTPRAASKGAVRGIKPFQKNILIRPPLKWYELES